MQREERARFASSGVQRRRSFLWWWVKAEGRGGGQRGSAPRCFSCHEHYLAAHRAPYVSRFAKSREVQHGRVCKWAQLRLTRNVGGHCARGGCAGDAVARGRGRDPGPRQAARSAGPEGNVGPPVGGAHASVVEGVSGCGKSLCRPATSESMPFPTPSLTRQLFGPWLGFVQAPAGLEGGGGEGRVPSHLRGDVWMDAHCPVMLTGCTPHYTTHTARHDSSAPLHGSTLRSAGLLVSLCW